MSRRFKFKKKEKERIDFFGTENFKEINGAHIEMVSNKEITIDGCCGVFEYGNDFLRLNIGRGSVLLYGKNFDIVLFENDIITIKGYISSLEFCV